MRGGRKRRGRQRGRRADPGPSGGWRGIKGTACGDPARDSGDGGRRRCCWRENRLGREEATERTPGRVGGRAGLQQRAARATDQRDGGTNGASTAGRTKPERHVHGQGRGSQGLGGMSSNAACGEAPVKCGRMADAYVEARVGSGEGAAQRQGASAARLLPRGPAPASYGARISPRICMPAPLPRATLMLGRVPGL